MEHRIEVYLVTLSDHQGHLPPGSLFKCNFSYCCATVDKLSTDIARRAVPL